MSRTSATSFACGQVPEAAAGGGVHVPAPIENIRRAFLDHIRDINADRERPRFYNTLTTKCTTMIYAHTTMNPGHVPLSWKILLTGYALE